MLDDATTPSEFPSVLQPFVRQEATSVACAADAADKSCETIRRWIAVHGIGRKIGGQYAVSRVALAMLLEGDAEALTSYLDGDRSGNVVAGYFARLSIPLPSVVFSVGKIEGSPSGVTRTKPTKGAARRLKRRGLTADTSTKGG